MDEPLTILVPARDEETRIGTTVARLRDAFPDAEVIVADDGSRDRTAEIAEEAGAVVLRLPRRGKGQALSAAERAASPGALLLCDADLSGELEPLLKSNGDLTVAVFAERVGGGFGLAKRVARSLIGVFGGIEVPRAAFGTARAVSGGEGSLFPSCGRVRLRGPDDDRRGYAPGCWSARSSFHSVTARRAATSAGSCTARGS